MYLFPVDFQDVWRLWDISLDKLICLEYAIGFIKFFSVHSEYLFVTNLSSDPFIEFLSVGICIFFVSCFV